MLKVLFCKGLYHHACPSHPAYPLIFSPFSLSLLPLFAYFFSPSLLHVLFLPPIYLWNDDLPGKKRANEAFAIKLSDRVNFRENVSFIQGAFRNAWPRSCFQRTWFKRKWGVGLLLLRNHPSEVSPTFQTSVRVARGALRATWDLSLSLSVSSHCPCSIAANDGLECAWQRSAVMDVSCKM